MQLRPRAFRNLSAQCLLIRNSPHVRFMLGEVERITGQYEGGKDYLLKDELERVFVKLSEAVGFRIKMCDYIS